MPDDIYAAWDARASGAQREAAWNEPVRALRDAQFPREAAELKRRTRRRPAGGVRRHRWQLRSDAAAAKRETVATRKASQLALEALAPVLPELLGGSADLDRQQSDQAGAPPRRCDPTRSTGATFNYGVREFGMCAIANGIALHGGFIPFVGTFLVFSDYARNAVRMAALMKQRVILVFTHDSIGLGEDGPTHQAVEHAAEPAPDPAPRCLAAGRYGRNAGGVGGRDRAPRDRARPRLLLSRQNVPYVRRGAQRRPTSAAAAMCWRRRPAVCGTRRPC